MRGLLGIIVAAVIVIVGLSIYLAPDGLKACGQSPSDQPDCQKVGAIVAISGGDTSARTRQAIQLYNDGWSDKLVFSGAALDKTGPSNAQAMRTAAINSGVPEDAILIEEMSENTQQNAERSLRLFSENEIYSVILVTSGYHQRRAGLEFGKRAGNSIRIINHPVMTDNQWSAWWWTTPYGWWLATGEFFKIMVFYMAGNRT